MLLFAASVAQAAPPARKNAPPPAAKELSAAELDKALNAEWRKNQVTPAIPVDDARFLRRIYLDLTGAIPPASVVSAFLSDRAPDKRARAVAALLDSPSYADHFTNYWDKVLLGRQVGGNLVDRAAFRAWLHDELDKDEPWNTFVEKLLTANGQNSKGGVDAKKESNGKATPQAPPPQVNGAVNWLLKYSGNPTDLTGKVSRVFLGVQIQCAQCHDHPSEKWKQEDFRRLASCFSRTGFVPIDDGKMPGIRRVELRELEKATFGGPKKSELREIADSTPTALDGTDLSKAPNRRKALTAWLISTENPWFARAIVNRMWAYFLGRGFVDPIDDFRRSNPITAPEILDRLAADFVAHGYDLKHLIGLICATRAYQLAAAPARGPGDAEDKLWGHYRLRPMSPEALIDSLVIATGVDALLSKTVKAENLEKVKQQVRQLVTFLFDVDEEIAENDFEGTIPQALMLINGQLLNNATAALPGTSITEVLAMPVGDTPKIEQLYLRTLSRMPTAAEVARWTKFLNADREVVNTGKPKPVARVQDGKTAKGTPQDPMRRIAARLKPGEATPKSQAFEDLQWALLNSSEFFFKH